MATDVKCGLHVACRGHERNAEILRFAQDEGELGKKLGFGG